MSTLTVATRCEALAHNGQRNALAGRCRVTGRDTGDLRLRPVDQPFSLWEQTDDSLARLRRHHVRQAADFARDGDTVRARRDWFQAQEVCANQLQRFQLWMRYGAVDSVLGTDSYDCYLRHDERPTYWLALFMDSSRARSGRAHILSWPAQESS